MELNDKIIKTKWVFNAASSLHPLDNFKIKIQHQNEPRFNGVYSRDNLSERSSAKIKDRAYIINLDEYSDIGTHWISFYVQTNDNIYFAPSRVEHIP